MNNLTITKQLEIVSDCFEKINSDKIKAKKKVVKDCLMSGVALFSLKYPSLLKFNNDNRGDETVEHNIRALYKVGNVPSDTYMREVLDEVAPSDLRRVFTQLFRLLQVTKKLQTYRYLDNQYLLSVDGTQYFTSKTIHCKSCCQTEHKNGTISYHHKLIGGAIVHPNIKAVIPVYPEQIIMQDGVAKNDCELAAVKRFLMHFRREHPHLRVTVLEDALFATVPHLQLLKELNFGYIIRVKSTGHKHLFEEVKASSETTIVKEIEGDSLHRYRFLNQVSLTKGNPEERVNFIECIEIKKDGKKSYFTFITNQFITEKNVYQIMRAGRARWKIENETFNTLKNQGYEFEHNFGHGKKQLSVIFSLLMMIAFLIDQIQLIGSSAFMKALQYQKSKSGLWEKMRSIFFNFRVKSWDDLLLALSGKMNKPELCLDSS